MKKHRMTWKIFALRNGKMRCHEFGQFLLAEVHRGMFDWCHV